MPSKEQCSPNNACIDKSAPIQLNANTLLKELTVDEFFKALDDASVDQLQSLINTFEKSTTTTNAHSPLFDVPAEPRTAGSIFEWWEYRRLPFNVVVGASGLIFLLYLACITTGPSILITTFMYALFANICYTLGAPSELLFRACLRSIFPSSGPMLLQLCTLFFVLLTIFGGSLMCIFPHGGL
jgi:hypothetical protein